MNLETVKSLFTLFSGEEDTVTFSPVITAAVHEVEQQLREGASDTDVRLCYLAAAVANLRYTQIYGAREKALATYAGTIARVSDASQQIRFAKQLVYSYQKLCAELIYGDCFLFAGIRGGCCAGII